MSREIGAILAFVAFMAALIFGTLHLHRDAVRQATIDGATMERERIRTATEKLRSDLEESDISRGNLDEDLDWILNHLESYGVQFLTEPASTDE